MWHLWTSAVSPISMRAPEEQCHRAQIGDRKVWVAPYHQSRCRSRSRSGWQLITYLLIHITLSFWNCLHHARALGGALWAPIYKFTKWDLPWLSNSFEHRKMDRYQVGEGKVKLHVGEDDQVVGGPAAGTNNNFWKPFPTLKLNSNHSTSAY